jgi:hypothetical protein
MASICPVSNGPGSATRQNRNEPSTRTDRRSTIELERRNKNAHQQDVHVLSRRTRTFSTTFVRYRFKLIGLTSAIHVKLQWNHLPARKRKAMFKSHMHFKGETPF